MAKFYVGQRVRVVGGPGGNPLYRHMDGEEGVISGPCACLNLGCPCWELHGFYTPFGDLIGFHPDELEPILDPGRELVSWDACLWQPQGVEA
jgi:hypothetical protein